MGLRVYEFGPENGRPLVALHGLKGYGGRWREIAGLLPEFRVYAPDLRGHGRSPFEPPWSLTQHAVDLEAVLDSFGLDRADVVGHSFGGAVALGLALVAPDRVRRLVLLDPSIGVPPSVALTNAMREFDVPSFASPDEAAAVRAQQWPVQAHHRLPREVEEHLAQDADGRWRWRYNAAMAVAAFSDMARDLMPGPGTPTLVVRATRGAIPPEQIERWRLASRGALTVEELHCGHQVYLEQPKETADLIRRFT
jgi:lipase